MKTLKLLIIGLAALCLKPGFAQEKAGALIGVVSDLENMETLPFVNVVIKDIKGNIIAGGVSDLDGEFNINPIAPGHYTIEASFAGYETEVFKQVKVKSGEKTKLNILLIEGSYELIECVITCQQPVIDITRTVCWWKSCGNILSTGLSDSEIIPLSFSIFPNPSTGELNLKADSEISEVLITNMNGQSVSEISVDNPNDISANLSHLPAATYIVHFSDGISRKSQLWILQH
ncbi:carboxypeptidase-like regulatory domain-containing protein [Owenweeksia hongkongensis]|uniref:carboxypeptidase-like regulatory domain-containing protein n=1 Tax=Owenweeksia hongkongensis TaxID=253245 RepID=UPI003A95DDDF